jgi:hypothetical protein
LDACIVATWIHGEETSLAVDDTYFPVVFATWKGSADPTVVEAAADFLDAQLGRAAAEGVRLVCIHDALGAKRPRADMRETWEGLTQRLSGRAEEIGTLSIVIVDNTLVRSVMTAVVFFANARKRTRVTDTRAKAIDMALQRLDAQGDVRPKGLHPDSYRPPNFTAAAV